jgi:hypothetical protein
MVAGGTARPANVAAHHIVAFSDPRAAIARTLLKNEGIGLNEAVNGVFLPKNLKFVAPPATTHSILHTDAYFIEVNSRLLNAAPGTLRTVLGQIRQELLLGTFRF